MKFKLKRTKQRWFNPAKIVIEIDCISDEEAESAECSFLNLVSQIRTMYISAEREEEEGEEEQGNKIGFVTNAKGYDDRKEPFEDEMYEEEDDD